ncbi:MAG: FtsQ-type POTRA domain-containing protein [Candidatus Hatepunaea meridiana]|nr:FtsQ-type POTRA domain-containing protein [Candidatus Hatepunaea meridiana]
MATKKLLRQVLIPDTTRKRYPRRSKRGKFILFTIVALLIGIGIWWGGSAICQVVGERIACSSLSVVERIEVVGLMRLPQHDILSAAGVNQGDNLMKLDYDSISARVMEIPGVRNAKAIRRLPRRLLIRVEERIPIAAVNAGELLLIDEEGVVFQPVYGGEVLDLPVLTGMIKPDKRETSHSEESELTPDATMITKIRNNYPVIYQHLSEIQVIDDNIALRLRQGGALVKTDGMLKMETLDDLELFLTQKGAELPVSIEYVDLRFPTMIITGNNKIKDEG